MDDENYWLSPTVGPFVEIAHVPATVLHPVNPHCPNCLQAMMWASVSGRVGVAHCYDCKVTVTANRFLEVPPVNP